MDPVTLITRAVSHAEFKTPEIASATLALLGELRRDLIFVNYDHSINVEELMENLDKAINEYITTPYEDDEDEETVAEENNEEDDEDDDNEEEEDEELIEEEEEDENLLDEEDYDLDDDDDDEVYDEEDDDDDGEGEENRS